MVSHLMLAASSVNCKFRPAFTRVKCLDYSNPLLNCAGYTVYRAVCAAAVRTLASLYQPCLHSQKGITLGIWRSLRFLFRILGYVGLALLPG